MQGISNSNQKNYYDQSNAKLDRRTFEFANVRPNIIMENNKLYEQKNSYYNNGYERFNQNKNIGEITGDSLEISMIDKGMPLRSNCNFSKKKNIEDEKGHNRFTDFDIFEEDKQLNLDISYYDPDGGKMCGFDDIIEKSVLHNSDPLELVNYTVNDFNWYMMENIKNLLNENIFYTTTGILTLMGTLYIASNSQTENNLLNYFNFPEKQTLFDGLNELNSQINQSQCIDIKNFIFMGQDYELNELYTKYIENMVNVYTLKNNDPQNEANKINIWLNKIYGNLPGNIFNSNHIKNLDTTCLSVGVLRTVWKTPFEKIILHTFKGKEIANKQFMYNSSKTYDYFEDNIAQLIELPMYDNILSMGIILPKTDINMSHNSKIQLPQIGIKEFNLYISNLKPTNLDEVAIPKFNQHSKIRISSIFKKTGLENLFAKLEIPELTKKSSMLTDVIQNIYLIVDNKYMQSKDKYDNYNRGAKSNRKFIADRSFIYYFRCIKTNTVIMTGQYI